MKKFRDQISQNYQLRLRPSLNVDRNPYNAYRTYETSWETEYLQSESNRIIYGELIDWIVGEEECDKVTVNKSVTKENIQVDDKSVVNDDDEEVKAPVGDKTKWWTKLDVKPNRPVTLREIALNVIAKGYKKGSIDDRITCQNAIDFASEANIELPFTDLLELDNEYFWKRKVKKELSNSLEFEKLSRDPKTNWKKISVELNFRNFVENLNPGDFNYLVDRDKIIKFTKSLKKFIENLKIRKLKTPKIKKETFKVVNFSSHDCEHVNLEFLGHLTKIKKLSIEFNPGVLKKNYEKRVFDVAVDDIKNLSNGIKHMEELEELEIINSNLSEDEKIQNLLNSIQDFHNLTTLNLTNCKITSGISGESFEKFITQNESIKSIELKDNNLNYEFCINFANGIFTSKVHLDYLGLSFNPILLNGLTLIINSIRKKDNVDHLNISGCEGGTLDTYENFTGEFCKFLLVTKNLKFIDITNINIPDEDHRLKIIQAFNANTSIVNFAFDPNDFPSPEPKEAFWLELINRRNKFYFENPILRKDTFTKDDEEECIKWLRRVKHPSLLKYKRKFEPSEVKVKHENQSKKKMSSVNYENFHFTFHPGMK